PTAPTGGTFAGMPATIDAPGLYGITTATRDVGGGRTGILVDRADSAAPLVLLLVETATPPAAWAGVQALLEREGIASMVVRDAAAAGGAELVAAMARRRSQPWSAIAAGGALAALGAVDADVRVVVLDPSAPSGGGWRARLPGFVARRFG